MLNTMTANQQSEKEIAERLKRLLDARLTSKYATSTGKAILYKIGVDGLGNIKPGTGSGPMRGHYAFQTDLLIERKSPSVPMVAAELKYGGFSTHDVITYSAKAVQHKSIYPYLRYGFIVIGANKLGRRFLTHNQGFDFALAVPQLAAHEEELVELMRRQITSAECIRAVMQTERVKFTRYEQSTAVE